MNNLNPLYENQKSFFDFYNPEIILPNTPEKYLIYVSQENNRYKISLKPSFIEIKMIPKNIIDFIIKIYLHFKKDDPNLTGCKLFIYKNHINDIIPIVPKGKFQRAWI